MGLTNDRNSDHHAAFRSCNDFMVPCRFMFKMRFISFFGENSYHFRITFDGEHVYTYGERGMMAELAPMGGIFASTAQRLWISIARHDADSRFHLLY